MITLLRFIEQNGPALTAGVTALLALGCAGAALCRSPVHRQRICELSVLAAVAWAVLTCVPLPRLEWSSQPPATAGAGRAEPAVTTDLDPIPPELVASNPPGPPSNEPRPAADPVNPPMLRAPRSWPAAAAAYFTGAAACTAWLALGCIALRRLARQSIPAPAVEERANSMLDAPVPRVRVRVSMRLAGPMTCGVRRPLILLPAELLQPGREQQLRQVLRHEVGHVRQGDGWGNLLFCAALPLLYFHPAYWWLRRQAELARQLVVDDWAARSGGKDAYVTHLVALARSCAAAPGLAAGAIGIFRRRSHFYRRMRMLLQRSEPLPTTCSKPWGLAFALATAAAVLAPAAFVGNTPAIAQSADGKGDPPKPPAVGPTTVQTTVAVPDGGTTLLSVDTANPDERQLQALLAKARADVEAYNAKLMLLKVNRAAAANRAAAGNPPAALQPPGTRQAPNADATTEPPAAVRSTQTSPTPQGAIGGVQLDLVNLANTLVDAAGAYRQAQIAVEERERLKNTPGFSHSELAGARVKLETAQKRLQLLRAIAQVAHDSARQSHARIKKMYEMGLEGGQALEEAAGKVRMLEVVLTGGE